MKTLYDNEFVFLWEFHDDIVHNEHFYVLNGLGFVHWSSSQEVLRVSMCQESLARSEVRENRASKPPTDAACNDSWLCCCCRRKHSERGPNIWEGEFTNLLGLGMIYLVHTYCLIWKINWSCDHLILQDYFIILIGQRV